MKVPKFRHYAEGRSGKNDINAVQIITENVTVWYSYNTIIAFQIKGEPLVCCENIWSKTTGSHLNWIEPDKCKRFNSQKFKYKYFETFGEEWANNY